MNSIFDHYLKYCFFNIMSDEETEFIDSFSRYEKKSKLKDNTAVVIAEKK